MSFLDFVDLSSDDDDRVLDVRVVKQEPDIDQSSIQQKKQCSGTQDQNQKSKTHSIGQEPLENGNLNNLTAVQSRLDELNSPANGPSFASRLPPPPVCRQFWKAGDYDDAQTSKVLLQGGQNHLRVHPKFLHSNATSHKWAFGAIAELLDNAFDEIQNGATAVFVDKTSNPRDGSPALLIQDDGGGMDPESIRHCMSFGFSAKKSKSSIGQYGNGFKTSTMRLGADVIVFSRHINKNRTLTQSVGLLSYTFLSKTGHDRILVPVVDYEFDVPSGKFKTSSFYSAEHFSTNLSMLLQWSPYHMESELLKQFDDIGHHGTKVMVYNLWLNDDGNLELDFESDAEDILISGAPKVIQTQHLPKMINQQHIANRFNYSLRVYSSILYLRIPKTFRIILRGRVVEHHNIADDLKYPEFILYRPHVGGNPEAAVITTIGFLKDAPQVNIHGFSVYHKNRLIMPFWRVVSQTNSRGRGVAGVLEANFIEPTHNKQDFEKTSLFQKLEARLKEMTLEYWDFHCGLIGYQQTRKTAITSDTPRAQSSLQPVTIKPSSPAINSPKVASVAGHFQDVKLASSLHSGGIWGKSVGHSQVRLQSELSVKRKGHDLPAGPELVTRNGLGVNGIDSRHNEHTELANGNVKRLQDKEVVSLKQENKKLRAQCSDYEKTEEELNDKIQQLRIELLEVQHEYARLLAISNSLEPLEDEKT